MEPEDEYTGFDTLGTSIDDAFSFHDIDEDVDEVDSDDYGDE